MYFNIQYHGFDYVIRVKRATSRSIQMCSGNKLHAHSLSTVLLLHEHILVALSASRSPKHYEEHNVLVKALQLPTDYCFSSTVCVCVHHRLFDLSQL